MTGKFVLVVHPEADTAHKVSEALGDAGLKVMAVTSDAEALERLGRFFVPDVLVTRFDPTHEEGSAVLAHLRANPLTRHVPAILLASGDPEERRKALRAGVTHLVPPPYDGEEVVLNARLALERHRDERLLTGTLEQLPVTDLLQTAETARRTGIVTFRSSGRTGTLWLRDGRIIDAEIDDGRRGKEAVFALAIWQKGTFEADFRPINVPERISEPTSFLLLEAMRRRDEAGREEEAPPFAALPDPPPQPPRAVLAAHRALTLLNIAASYAADHLAADLLATRLESCRRELSGDHPPLGAFSVEAGGRVALDPEGAGEEDVELLAQAVGAWLRDFFDQTERALPGRFSLARLAALTETIQEDLEDLGFYRALGLASTQEETP